MKARYEQQRAMFIAYLGGKCAICGSTDDLQFDHKDPSDKSFDVAPLWGLNRIGEVLRELAKCQLLCGKHHRAKSAREASARQNGTFQHGTLYGWLKKKCRCSVCAAAKVKYMEDRNRARRKRDTPNRERRKAEHGSVEMYSYHGCRCQACRAANTVKRRLDRIRASTPTAEGTASKAV